MDADDHAPLGLAARHSGFGPWTVPLDPDDTERATRIARESTVVSLHEHAVRFPADLARIDESVRAGRGHTDYEVLSASPLDGVFDMHFDGLRDSFQERVEIRGRGPDVGIRASDVALSEFAIRVLAVGDIPGLERPGRWE